VWDVRSGVWEGGRARGCRVNPDVASVGLPWYSICSRRDAAGIRVAGPGVGCEDGCPKAGGGRVVAVGPPYSRSPSFLQA
jgi:hypothetical protein